jgi:mannose-6-phosphate isomerase-like protein (cupin superfamily)
MRTSTNPKRIHRGAPYKIAKGWGHELIIANELGNDNITETGYCLKLLVFNDENVGSMHFHGLKHETFYILKGFFKLKYIDPATADELEMPLVEGDIVVIPQLCSHQITCTKGGGTIVEVSSPDRPEDSYRVAKGDSQK